MGLPKIPLSVVAFSSTLDKLKLFLPRSYSKLGLNKFCFLECGSIWIFFCLVCHPTSPPSWYRQWSGGGGFRYFDISSCFIIFILAVICSQTCNFIGPQCKHAITLTFNVILSYAVLLIESKDQEGQSHVLSAALEVCMSYTIFTWVKTTHHQNFAHLVNQLHQLQ